MSSKASETLDSLVSTGSSVRAAATGWESSVASTLPLFLLGLFGGLSDHLQPFHLL